MVGEGEFPRKSRKVPAPDATRNYFQEEVVGNKTDAAVTSPGTTKSLQAYVKGGLNNDATILAAVTSIQNNTRFTAAIPTTMEKPSAGDKAYNWLSNLYDTIGNLEDPDDSEILILVTQADGTPITANLYKEVAMSNALDNATDQVNFPSASGWRAMEREDVGRFFLFYKVAHDETEEDLNIRFGWGESSVIIVQDRTTRVTDVFTDQDDTISEVASHALEQSQVLSQIESSADQIQPEHSEIGSEVASHALEQSTILSELDSAAVAGSSDNSEISSEVASHALEQSITLSENQSFALEQNTEEGYTQSEIASHSLEQSTQMSENESGAVSHALSDSLSLSQIESSTDGQTTLEGQTQSELASHVLEQSEGDSELLSHALDQDTQEGHTQSEIASHVVEQSEVDSNILSVVAGGGTDHSETQSILASHALETSTSLSQVESSTDGLELDNSEIKSEIASHAVAESEQLSTIRSSLEA
ncbi:MAG: hypothetical protein ACTSVR_04685 [Candidatus Thorarchaeota archaeon]